MPYWRSNLSEHTIWEANSWMTTRAGSRQQELIKFLESIGIDVNLVPYPAHSTVEEGRFLRGDMPGTFTKNLLLKDKRGRLFLVVAEEARSIDLRTLHAKIGARGRLGFAPPDICTGSPWGRAGSTYSAGADSRWQSCDDSGARRQDNHRRPVELSPARQHGEYRSVTDAISAFHRRNWSSVHRCRARHLNF